MVTLLPWTSKQLTDIADAYNQRTGALRDLMTLPESFPGQDGFGTLLQ